GAGSGGGGGGGAGWPAPPACRGGRGGRDGLGTPEHLQTRRRESRPQNPRLIAACLVCRASCAGRGMAVARAISRFMLAVPARPHTPAWVGQCVPPPPRHQEALGPAANPVPNARPLAGPPAAHAP